MVCSFLLCHVDVYWITIVGESNKFWDPLDKISSLRKAMGSLMKLDLRCAPSLSSPTPLPAQNGLNFFITCLTLLPYYLLLVNGLVTMETQRIHSHWRMEWLNRMPLQNKFISSRSVCVWKSADMIESRNTQECRPLHLWTIKSHRLHWWGGLAHTTGGLNTLHCSAHPSEPCYTCCTYPY